MNPGQPETPTPILTAFPLPGTPELSKAYLELFLSANGSDEDKKRIGNPALLPRPWDPSTCNKPALRRELWDWLEQFVTWLNHEYTWDHHAGMVPPCWPHHPHLVREIAVLADQRRRAAVDTTSSSLEEWHRYCLPAFYDRLKARTKSCDEDHKDWPAGARYKRHVSAPALAARRQRFSSDVDLMPRAIASPEPAPSHEVPKPSDGRPQLRIVDSDGARIDPSTGEVLGE